MKGSVKPKSMYVGKTGFVGGFPSPRYASFGVYSAASIEYFLPARRSVPHTFVELLSQALEAEGILHE